LRTLLMEIDIPSNKAKNNEELVTGLRGPVMTLDVINACLYYSM
jgi:hypothetical protein